LRSKIQIFGGNPANTLKMNDTTIFQPEIIALTSKIGSFANNYSSTHKIT